MGGKELADFLLQTYDDRSKLPDDKEQLYALIFLAECCKQQLADESAMRDHKIAVLEKLVSRRCEAYEVKKKAKK